ncbi:MAG TPA: hypothetical protein VGF27_17705 [Pseudoduganella sp.]|jgi:hypothetical protein
MRINDTWRGALILGAVIIVFIVGAIALSEHGLQKVSCVGRALAGGVAFSNIHSVCGL